MSWRTRRPSAAAAEEQRNGRGPAPTDPRPDLVLVMTDQQRSDQTGYASGGYVETPTLDRWAAGATTFDRACSASTTCVPSRVSILTGLDAHRVPVLEDGFTMQPGFWTVAHALREAGYQTALAGKMHFIPHDADHGFDVMHTCEHLFPPDFTEKRKANGGLDHYHDWLTAEGLRDWRKDLYTRREPGQPVFPLDPSAHPTNWIADRAIEVLRRRDPDRPLFLVVSFPHPHEPHNPAAPYDSMYPLTDSVLPADGFEVNAGLPEEFLEPMTVKSGVWGPSHIPSEAFLRQYLARTRALIRHIDDVTEQILEHVDRSRTVTAFTTDHGDYGGHRGLIRKVPWIPFEDLVRVPLVVDAPDGVPGQRIDEPVSTADLTLTFLDYAGVPAPAVAFDSRSLRPLLTGTAQAADRDRTLLFSPNSGWPSLLKGRYKLLTRPVYFRRACVLLDLEEDPGETVDLAQDPGRAPLVADLEQELMARLLRPVEDLPAPRAGGEVLSPAT